MSQRKLHIGGKEKKTGWEIFNAIKAPEVEHVGNANDLSRFEDNTFAKVYASHVLEHFDYKDELLAVLKEWHRILKPGGELMVSVPDMDILSWLFVNKVLLTPDDRFQLMRMFFGGHVDAYDYHLVGLNMEFLGSFLTQAGYGEIRRVERLGVFADTSNMLFKGIPISLNVTAKKV